MENRNTVSQRVMVSGTCASVLSTAALATLGKRETGSAFAPTNAISHWIWGDEAATHNAPSLRHTAAGYLIHHASATFWAMLFERVLKGRPAPSVPAVVTAASATAAVACFADYKLTPHRLRPGYEMRLSRSSLAIVYGAFALGLTAGALINRRT
jgi:hypothetical protein